MYLMIDNYDSFVYNLVSYFRECGCDISVVRNDALSVRTVSDLLDSGDLEGLIVSPGPGKPSEYTGCMDILEAAEGRVPVLGVCLGHQMIAYRHGASVVKGSRPMHGKVTPLTNVGRGLFEGLPERFSVTRYHSLTVSEEGFPDCLRVDARSEDGAVMAISHRESPVFGVQFHPEAVLTEYGHDIIANFVRICEGSS